jgi:bacillolysin
MKRNQVLFQIFIVFCSLKLNSQNKSFFEEAHKNFKDKIARRDNSGWLYFKENTTVLKGEIINSYIDQKNSKDQFKEISSKKDKKNNSHIKYQQYYKGILVEAGILIEHFKNGNLKSINGNYQEGLTTDVKPKITENKAIEIAILDFGDKKFMWQDSTEEAELKKDSENSNSTYFPQPKLVIDIKGNLVYLFKISATEGNVTYRINAINGKIESKLNPVSNCFSQTKHNHLNKNINVNVEQSNLQSKFPKATNKLFFTDAITYGHTLFSGLQQLKTTISNCLFCSSKNRLIANNYSSKIETRDHQLSQSVSGWRREVTMSPTNTIWPVSELLHTQTHWSAQISYDYYFDIHSKSVGAGNGTMKIKSNGGFVGAFYLGDNRSLAIGQLFGTYLGAMDVIGHEFTHLMIHGQNSLGRLTSNGESNSLDESFSDILGTMIERYGNPNGWDWLLGNEVVLIRNVLNPSLSPFIVPGNGGPQPEIYQGANWDFSNSQVHINGGVQNKWFTLLSLGGTHNGITVQGIGIDNAEQIVLHNLENYITQISDFQAAANGAIASASDLYGNCSFIHQQTALAWVACGRGQLVNCAIDEDPNTNKSNIISSSNNSILDEVIIYPNPVVNYLKIVNDIGSMNYKIINVAGKLMLDGRIHNNEIDVSTLPNGIYYLQLQNFINAKNNKMFTKISN